jgi:hypothetical protein
MRESFDKAFELIIGLEGDYSNDPDDPGGETKYGICKRYNPGIDIKNLTVDQAKDIYLTRYWIPAGCDSVPFPFDVCLFDGAVNPQNDPHWSGAGNFEILNLNPENWQEFLLYRMVRYMKNSKPKYKLGHIQRAIKLFGQIKELSK